MEADQQAYWRGQARLIAPSELQTELYLELQDLLTERDPATSDDSASWAEEVSTQFTAALEKSVAKRESGDPELALSELFFSEGVEYWLEALELFESGAEADAVLEVAEKGQRMLVLVQIMAEGV